MSIPTVRIFISSPADVAEEREKAREVIRTLSKVFAGKLHLLPVLWEDLTLSATSSFQHGIELEIENLHDIDIAVFILWSRLGSALGSAFIKPDGEAYRSGTEREFDLMMKAREKSENDRPEIFVYRRTDEQTFNSHIASAKSIEEQIELISQRKALESFVESEFQDSGANTRAYLSFKNPLGFSEMLLVHLKKHLQKMLDGTLQEEIWDKTPYMGLLPFKQEHSEIYFGREEEIHRFLEKMEHIRTTPNRFILLLGPSGSGKSSFLQAGVLPCLENFPSETLQAEWRQIILTPSQGKDDIISYFCTLLCEDSCLPSLKEVDFADLLKEAKKDFESVVDLNIKPIILKQSTNELPVRIVVIIDQFEEFFTTLTESAQKAFSELLSVLGRSELFFVIVAMRNDFSKQFQSNQTLTDLKGNDGQFDLLPPDGDAIERIICLSAKLAGYKFEVNENGDSLAQVIIRDFKNTPNALPLLEYLLSELVNMSTTPKLLSFRDYTSIGGLQGAIGKSAEDIYQASPEKDAVAQVFPLLVTISEESIEIPLRRRCLINVAKSTPASAAIVEAFVSARLLTIDSNEIYVSHDALFTHWPLYSKWISANKVSLASRKSVEDSFSKWQNAQKNRDYLLSSGKPVSDAQHLLENHAELIDEDIAVYISKSIKRSNLSKRLWKIAFVVLGITAISSIVATIFALRATSQARAQFDRAEASLKLVMEERDRAEKLNVTIQRNNELLTEIIPFFYEVNLTSPDLRIRKLAKAFLANCRGVFQPDYYPDDFAKSLKAAFFCQLVANSIAQSNPERLMCLVTGDPCTHEERETLQEALNSSYLMRDILDSMSSNPKFAKEVAECKKDGVPFAFLKSKALMLQGTCLLFLGDYNQSIAVLHSFVNEAESLPLDPKSTVASMVHSEISEAYANLSHSYRLIGDLQNAQKMMAQSLASSRKMKDADPEKTQAYISRYTAAYCMGLLDDPSLKYFLALRSTHQITDAHIAEMSASLSIPAFHVESVSAESIAQKLTIQPGDTILEWGPWKYFSDSTPNGSVLVFNAIDETEKMERNIAVARKGAIIRFKAPPGSVGMTITPYHIANAARAQLKDSYLKYNRSRASQ